MIEEPNIQETDGLAVTSLVSGIISILMIFCATGFGIIPGGVAVTTGVISKKQEDKKSITAMTGIILGMIGILIPVIIILFIK